MNDSHNLLINRKMLRNTVFDYAKTEFFMELDGVFYSTDKFEVVSPKVNKLRVAKVEIRETESRVWIRTAKDKAAGDDAHYVTPTTPSKVSVTDMLLMVGDDELVDGRPIFFPEVVKEDLQLRFFSSDGRSSLLVSIV